MKTTTTDDSNGQSRDLGGGGDGNANIRGEGGAGGAAPQNSTKERAALSYLMLIKQIFQDQTEKYDMFMEFLMHFNERRIDPAELIERMKELFKGHMDLIFGFNVFLPKGYKITLEEFGASPPNKLVEYHEALNFTHKIKERFENDDRVYLSICDALRMFRNGSKDITEVYEEVSSLLANHPDIHKEFNRFFPYDFTTPSIQNAAYGQNFAQSFNKQSYTAAIKKQLHMDKPQSQHDKLITSHDYNLSIHSPKLDCGKALIKGHKKHTEQVEESRDRRVHDRCEREPDLSNKRGLKCVPERKDSVKKAEAPRMTADFPYDNKGTLKGREIRPDEYGACPPKKVVGYDEALDFALKIEERFQNDDNIFLSFCNALKMCRPGSKDVTEVYMEVSSLLANHPDLHEEFTRFWPYDFTTPLQHAAYGQNLVQCFNEPSSTATNKKHLHLDKPHSQHDKLITSHDYDLIVHSPMLDGGKEMVKEQKNCSKQVEESWNRRVHDQNERKPDISNNRGLECFPDKKLSVKKAEAPMLTADFTYDSIDTFKGKEREDNSEKYKGKSICELDLHDCECCNASYRLVPDDYPIPISSERSELDAEVLNDHWVSVTLGSEDHSFKHVPKNQYEKILFKCEDDQFELDLLLERAKSTAKCTEELYNSIVENKLNVEGPIRLEEYFSVLHLRCIERLYDDYGPDIVEALRQNPAVVLPEVLRRLKQKQKEWMECRAKFNKVWARIYAIIFYKSRLL